jgi:hypothetical protein
LKPPKGLLLKPPPPAAVVVDVVALFVLLFAPVVAIPNGEGAFAFW